MASNSFGNIFKISTWGESHGKAIGVVIDGCPSGISIDEEEINHQLSYRAPGKSPFVSPRTEKDQAVILSGTFQGKTTGAPICMMISNNDADPSKYEPIKDLMRPGHANFTYLEKYGHFDYRGGGRASARETACRVAAGAIAKKMLQLQGIEVVAYIKQIGTEKADTLSPNPISTFRDSILQSPLFCPDPVATQRMVHLLEKTKDAGDSLGGVVEFMALSVPPGLGDPVYEKLEARLAFAMMGLPASKGFEIGSGFHSTTMTGSSHNDPFINNNGKIQTETNHSGGILGGVSNGMPIIGRVAFKPTSSIKITQKTVSNSGEAADFNLPEGSRHDPCVAIRAVPVVEAMAALVLADAFMMNQCIR